MPHIAWNDSLVVGSPEIDAQHKQLIGIVNTFLDAMDQGRGDAAIGEALEELRDYTAVHFRDEEALMERIGFPGLDVHRREHNALLDKLGKRLDRIMDERPTVKDVHVLLKSWLVDHFIGRDTAIAEHLRARPETPPAPGAGTQSDFYAKLLENMYDGVYFVDRNRTVTYWNKGAERLSGFSREEVVGKSCADNILRHVDDEGRQLCLQGCPLAAVMEDGEAREVEVYMHHKQGHRVPVFVRGTAITDDSGEIVGAVEVFSSDDKLARTMELVRQLKQEAMHDALTGLGNRKYADMGLENHLLGLERHGIGFGLLFIDIDFFKKVNDTWGHNVGDEVLKMVAGTVANGLRPLDVPCRWGGEEFIAILPNVDLAVLEWVAERLRMLVENSWLEHDGETIRVTASLGGALAEPGDTAEDVVGRADAQVYRSKDEGRNRVSIHRP